MVQITSNSKVIRKPEVLTLLGISKSSLHNRIHAGELPEPFSLGGRSVGWYESEIITIIRARAAGKNNEQIKLLVSSLLLSRQLAA